MKLPKKMQWLKEHFQGLITEEDEQLWDKYETNKLEDYQSGSQGGGFDIGWELGRIEAIQEILNFIDDIENPVYGDV
jgi:hypothetical protein